MTVRTITICDVCGKVAERVETFATMLNGVKHEWDVGPCCMGTPFKVRQHRAVDVVVTVAGEVVPDAPRLNNYQLAWQLRKANAAARAQKRDGAPEDTTR